MTKHLSSDSLLASYGTTHTVALYTIDQQLVAQTRNQRTTRHQTQNFDENILGALWIVMVFCLFGFGSVF
jgi:hypothetical protein